MEGVGEGEEEGLGRIGSGRGEEGGEGGEEIGREGWLDGKKTHRKRDAKDRGARLSSLDGNWTKGVPGTERGKGSLVEGKGGRTFSFALRRKKTRLFAVCKSRQRLAMAEPTEDLSVTVVESPWALITR